MSVTEIVRYLLPCQASESTRHTEDIVRSGPHLADCISKAGLGHDVDRDIVEARLVESSRRLIGFLGVGGPGARV